jgi:hypothetical protein
MVFHTMNVSAEINLIDRDEVFDVWQKTSIQFFGISPITPKHDHGLTRKVRRNLLDVRLTLRQVFWIHLQLAVISELTITGDNNDIRPLDGFWCSFGCRPV